MTRWKWMEMGFCCRPLKYFVSLFVGGLFSFSFNEQLMESNKTLASSIMRSFFFPYQAIWIYIYRACKSTKSIYYVLCARNFLEYVIFVKHLERKIKKKCRFETKIKSKKWFVHFVSFTSLVFLNISENDN